MSDPTRSDLTTIEFSILLFVSIKPRTQISIAGLLPILMHLASLDLVTSTEMLPGMPEENIWTVTWAGLQLIKEWQQDAHNRHRQFGPSSVLPQ